MSSGLPARITEAASLREVYEALLALPSRGPFLAYQYAVDLAYSTVTTADESQVIVRGAGSLDGISKCFTDTGGLTAVEIIAWMHDTSRDHFARLGLDFAGLWGRWPTLIDWQNVFCEVSKYTRATHPHVRGMSGRTRIKQEFHQNPEPIDYQFPPKWELPPSEPPVLRVREHRRRMIAFPRAKVRPSAPRDLPARVIVFAGVTSAWPEACGRRRQGSTLFRHPLVPG